MSKFRALLKGANLLLHSEDLQRIAPSGFYVTAFINAASTDAARDSAIALVQQSHVYAAARNTTDDPPRIAVEELEEISDWPVGTPRPLTGFAIYDESSSADERPNI